MTMVRVIGLMSVLLVIVQVHQISGAKMSCQSLLQRCRNRRPLLKQRRDAANEEVCEVSDRVNMQNNLDWEASCHESKIKNPCTPNAACAYLYGSSSTSARRNRATSDSSYEYECIPHGQELDSIEEDPNSCSKTYQSCKEIETATNLFIAKNMKAIPILKTKYNETEIKRLQTKVRSLKEKLKQLSNTACPKKTASSNSWEYWAEWGRSFG